MKLCAVICCVLLTLPGCGESDTTVASRARREGMYDPGTPRFDFEGTADLRDSLPGVRCTFAIPYSSLVFVRSGTGLTAYYEIRLRLAEKPGGAALSEVSWQGSVGMDSSAPEKVVRIADRWIAGPPGEATVEATLEDLSSMRSAVRMQRVELFSPTEETPRILRPALSMTRGGEEVPVLSPQIPLGVPDLHATVTIRNPGGIAGGSCTVTLFRYPIDTLPASPPYFLNSLGSTLRRNGVVVWRREPLWRRTIATGRGSLLIERIPLEGMRVGLYELAVRCSTEELEQRRLIVRVDPDFPKCVRLRAIVDPMVYILREDAFKELNGDPDSLRARFERIWLSYGGSPDGAKNLIRILAERIEQANLSFSTFKEGWKSDQGMVSIVFGPPAFVEREFRKERWVYGSGLTFLFEQVTTPLGDELIENWVLLRGNGYLLYWDKEIDRWRNGRVF